MQRSEEKLRIFKYNNKSRYYKTRLILIKKIRQIQNGKLTHIVGRLIYISGPILVMP